MSTEKQKAIDAAMAEIEKQFGKGTIMRMGDVTVDNTPSIPTGALNLDVALGVGGIPRGRIIEIYGPESSGKTTLTLSIIAQAQKMGGICGFVDAEHAMDADYAKRCGVDVDELLLSQPDNGEQALTVVETLVRSNSLDLIVVDSVAALVPQAEIDGEMGDSLPGLQARLMSQALRKLTAIVSKSKTSVIFINQLREKIGVMFGSPETTPGGKALKFYSSVRLDIRRVETIKKGEEAVGNRVKVKTVKNKCAPPFREALFDIIFGKGISREGCIIDMGVEYGIVEKAGSWFAVAGGERLAQGRDGAVDCLRANPALTDKLEAAIWEKIKAAQAKALEEAQAKTAARAAVPAPTHASPGEGGASKTSLRSTTTGKP